MTQDLLVLPKTLRMSIKSDVATMMQYIDFNKMPIHVETAELFL